MKRIVSLLTALCLMSGVALASAESLHIEGKPWINSNLYGIWPSERPAVEETFELYANYDLYQEALAQGKRMFYMPLSEAQKLANQQVASLYTDPDKTGPEAECLRILYGLYTATEQGPEAFAPLLPYAERLRAAKSVEELAAVIREDGWLYGKAFFEASIKTTDRMRGKVYVSFSTTEPIEDLPLDEETFESPGKDVDSAKEKLLRLGWSGEEIPRLIEKVVSFYDYNRSWEYGSYTELERELMSDSSRLVSLNEVREVCPLIYELLKAQGLAREGAEAEPAYSFSVSDLQKVNALWQEADLDAIKGILALSMYNAAESVLPKDAAEDPVSTLEWLIPQALRDQGFVRNFVAQERIELYKQLTEEYRKALRTRIEKNDWVSVETKQAIYRKLDQLVASDIFYPDGEFDCMPLLEKLRSCSNAIEAYGWCAWFQHRCEAHYAGTDYVPANRFGTQFGTSLAEGGYQSTENVFYLGGASLCDIMLDMTSRETILGTFGAHLSHELSHAFDTTGSQYNADFTGSLFAAERDREIFEQKTEAIKKQISAIEVLDGVYSNGEAQIGEVLADLTGMSLTLDMVRDTENFDYDAYFRAFAYFFSAYQLREQVSPEGARNIHPYCYLRINFTVQHFDEFYRTYPSVTEGTPMYLAPEERILIW